MSNQDRGHDFDAPASEHEVAGTESLEKILRGRLRSVKNASERRTIAGLAREIGHLPGDVARAALEVGAGLAGVSLRASVEFLKAATEAARVLDAEELRAWGEMGKRLAMADVETGAAFFAAGVGELAGVPRGARLPLFQVAARQMALSSSIALETFRRAPEIARAVDDAAVLGSIFEVALEISRRSAKHSADFLAATPRVMEHLSAGFGDERGEVARAAVHLAGAFAARAGGLAADVWASLPTATEGLTAEAALKLFERAEAFLDRGGAASLHALTAGGDVLRLVPEAFEEWCELLRLVAEKSNAGLVALARTSPAFFRSLVGQTRRGRAVELARRVVVAAREVAEVDAEAAIACFRSGPAALRGASIEQFETWVKEGLQPERGGSDARARRSYYALETRQSNEALRDGASGLSLESVAQTLRLYVEALTGRAVDVAPLAAMPEEARIGDGQTIYLPSSVARFGDDALNFRLYKVLAAHAAGQIEFGTHARDSDDLRAAYASIGELYAPENVDALDAFALDGYINEREKGERALAPEEEARRARAARKRLPKDSDYHAALALFPHAALATRIFGTLENGRIDRRLRTTYRGLRRDLDMVRDHLRDGRPRIANVPISLVPFELLFQITLCGGALDDARSFYGQIVSELEGIVADYLAAPDATVADTLMATSRVYTLFQSVVPAQTEQLQEFETSDEGADGSDEMPDQDARDQRKTDEPQEQPEPRDARELFNAWASTDALEGDPDELLGADRWAQGESAEQDLEAGEVAFSYDEWDRELADNRVGWCRVIEKRVKRGDRSFVELTRSRHRGVISSIKYQFQLMKPESLQRVYNEIDGDDYDLNAVIDYVADRRAGG